jgi:two-component system, chemotaxis family, sensor kinase CheA
MDKYEESFSEEAFELIGELERCMLLLEAAPSDLTLVQQVFRAMHTLKGNSSMFGFRAISEFTHHLESIYEYVRSGKKAISKDILDVTFQSLDHLLLLVKRHGVLESADLPVHQLITDKVIEVVRSIEKELNIEANRPSVKQSVSKDRTKNFHIYFEPYADIAYNGTNPLHLIAELQALGECLVVANVDALPQLEAIEPTHNYTSWNIYLTTEHDIAAVKEVFTYVEGRCSLEITMVNAVVDSYSSSPASSKNQSQELVNRAGVAGESGTFKKQVISSVRVPSERLDTLMGLVSELMTLQAKLGTCANQSSQLELHAIAENLEKLSSNLRDNAFSMCLVPVEHMVTPFHRLVRDLASNLNKEIELVTEGTETELDKNVIEGLSDPLMHLLRNSIDHGIEEPEIRLQNGKNRRGKILVKAYCAGAHVYIEIQDDGKGLDAEKIKSKALNKGLINADDTLSDRELFNLIFLPGFSTAEQVSETSGRGVGMDVVKKKIAGIRGQIKINSETNKGTTITIKLPITVSIIDGLLVKVGTDDYVIPLSAVDKCFEVSSKTLFNRFNNVIVVNGDQIPVVALGEQFDVSEVQSGPGEVVIVNYEEKRAGLLVDSITGKYQAVLKPLGTCFQQVAEISGATILGDGRIALVLDTNKIIDQFLAIKTSVSCQ